MSTQDPQALTPDVRTSPRHRALLGATLSTASGERRCNILNLSVGGALLDAAIPPIVGEPVTLVRGPLVIAGRVGWLNGHRFGVTFDHAISDGDVRAVTAGADQDLS